MVFFGDICFKLYFWPFLSHFVNNKGFLCPYNRPLTPFPIITLPPGVILTPKPTLPTTPTTVACPTFPVVCLPNGVAPDPRCPCIDPRRGVAVEGTASYNSSSTNGKLVIGNQGGTSSVPLLQTGPVASNDGLVFQKLSEPSPPAASFRSNGNHKRHIFW